MKKLSLIVFCSLLGACASTSKVNDTEPTLPTVEDRAVVDGKALPLPEQSVVVTEPLSGEPQMSPVVKRLMASAHNHRRQENWDSAAGALERALRIEPRNAMLWSQLAEVHFAQKAWNKAIQLAAKSNTLAGNHRQLRRQNWYLMANSYEFLGNMTAAQKYRSKLNR